MKKIQIESKVLSVPSIQAMFYMFDKLKTAEELLKEIGY